MHKRYYLIFFIFMLFFGCEKHSDTPIPGYFKIDKITLDHEKAIGITDAWVYVEGNIQGVYELPAVFPIIAEGKTAISIIPGIKVNGISGTRSYYPFYEPYEINIDVQASDSTTILPRSNYVDWSELFIVDDFEGASPQFVYSNTSDTTFILSQDAFQGRNSGRAYLDSAAKIIYFEAISKEQFEVPDFVDYSGMFLEMNYKGTEVIEVGIIVNESTSIIISDIIYLYASTDWKKIYIDLYNPLITFPKGTKYKIYIRSELSEGRGSGDIFVDDIKIVSNSEH